MNRLFVLTTALAAIILPALPQATAGSQQSPSSVVTAAPFGAGEDLVYSVSYRAALIPPINMMRISLRTFDEDLGGKSHFHIVGNGRTMGAAKGIFELNDTYHAWLDASTLLPSRTTSDIREDNYRLTTTYVYDWESMSVSGVRRNPSWDAPRRATFPLPSLESGDALSLIYRLRALDTDRMTPGEAKTLDLVLSEDAKPITLRFIGRERVRIRRIGTFNALKFTCTMATSDGSTYQEGMTFTAWISDDANHIPLMIESPVRIGRVNVTLADGSRTLHPLTSKIQ